MPTPSLLAQVAGGYSVSGSVAGDVYARSILTIPPTTPSTSQPAMLVVEVASSVPGSGNSAGFDNGPYHVDFVPSDGSAAFGLRLGGFNALGSLQYPNAIGIARFYCSDARVAVGGTLTLSVALDPAAAANHAWYSHAGTSDQGTIAALVLDPLVGAGLDARLVFGTSTGTNSGTSVTISGLGILSGQLRVWESASVNTSSPSLTGFTTGTNLQSGSTLAVSANNSTALYAVTYESGGGESVSATWSWIGSSVSAESSMFVDSTSHSAPPAPWAPALVVRAGHGWVAVIG